MAAAGSGALADSGCKGRRVRGCVGVVCAFPFWGGLGLLMGRQRKKAGRVMENRGCFLEGESEPVWQGKCGSVSGGRFGVCIQGSGPRRFSIGCSRAPPRAPFRFEPQDGITTQACQVAAPKLSAVSRHSSLVTRHSSPSLGGHDWQ